MVFQNIHGGGAAARRVDLQAAFAKDLPLDIQNGLFFIHQKCAACRERLGHRRRRRFFGNQRGAQWKGHGEHGAAGGIVAHRNLSTVLLDDPITDAEAQASPLPYRLGGVERVENPAWLADPRPGVGDLHTQAKILHARGDPDVPLTGHSAHHIEGIVENIQEHLL